MSMKYIFIFAFFSIFFLGGCIDPHYQAEKYFWLAEQNAKKIMEARSNKLQQEDYLEIIKGYRRVIEVAPVAPLSAKSQFLIANLFMAQQNYDEAHKELKRIVQNFSSDKNIASKAYFAMGKIWEMQGKFDDALEEYMKIMDFYPLSFLGMEMPLYMTQLCEKFKEKITRGWAFSQMIRHYQALIDEYKGTSVEHHLQNYLIRAYLKGENWDDMLKIWDDQIKDKKDKTGVIAASLSKAKLQATQLNNIPEAIKICEGLLHEYPDDSSMSEVRFYIGQLQLENKEPDKAGESFSSLLKDYPKEKELAVLCHFSLVIVDEKKGDYAGAILKLKKIREVFPEHPRSLSIPFLIYQNYEKIQDHTNALMAMKEAIKEYSHQWKQGGKEQNDLITGKLLLRCYLQLKDWDRAALHLQSFDERFPQTPYFLLLQAAIYADKMKLPLKARNVYDNILKKYSSNSKLTKAVEELVQNLEDKTVKTDE